MSEADFKKIPGIELSDDDPVFNEPWEASAFALVVGLHQQGLFEWTEWAEVLSETIHMDDANTPYYELWLIALEKILSIKKFVSDQEVLERQEGWKKALLATPHGQPIELKNGLSGL